MHAGNGDMEAWGREADQMRPGRSIYGECSFAYLQLLLATYLSYSCFRIPFSL